MIVFETQIRTGNPAGDQQMLQQLRAQHESQGNVVQVQPIPGGGFHVRCVRASSPPQQAYGGGAPQPYAQQAYGGPPAQPAYGGPPAQPAYGGPPPPGGAPYGGPGYGAPAMAGAFGGAASAPYAGPMSGGGIAGAVQEAWDEGKARVQYIRKVYTLLAISALFAIGAGWLVTSPLLGTETWPIDKKKTIEVPVVVAAMLADHRLEYAAFGLLFVGVFVASFVSKVPVVKYLALFGVSALMGLELAPMVFVAQVMAGMGETLSPAPVHATFAMVGAIFVGLTGYVFLARKDFSYLYATLSMGFWVVLAGCVVAFAIDSEPLTLAIASAGALLSIGFLLYQTSYIFKHSDMDDPVDDALGLIVQLRNLFMFLLRIFMSRR